MAEIVNLNRARKARARDAAALEAERNRVRFGRTGAEKRSDAAERSARCSLLDGRRLERDPPTEG